MIKMEACLICGGKRLEGRPARLAPFIRERCWGRPRPQLPARLHRFIAKVRTRLHVALRLRCLALLWCPDCDFAFFNYRYEPGEEARIYRAYRDTDYDGARIRLEPDYPAIAGLMEKRDNDYHSIRVAQVQECLDRHGLHPTSILDYGGESDGWLAQRAFPQARIRSYDLSDGSLLPVGETFALVTCAHVLEHVAAPVAFLKGLALFLGPQGVLYLEVPVEYPHRVADLLQPGMSVPLLHEHVSHFSAQALHRVLTEAGLVPEVIEPLENRYYRGLAVLARRMA